MIRDKPNSFPHVIEAPKSETRNLKYSWFFITFCINLIQIWLNSLSQNEYRSYLSVTFYCHLSFAWGLLAKVCLGMRTKLLSTECCSAECHFAKKMPIVILLNAVLLSLILLNVVLLSIFLWYVIFLCVILENVVFQDVIPPIVIFLNGILLNFNLLLFVLLNFVFLSVIFPNVILLSAVLPNVIVPVDSNMTK